jgi:hypothetical protein
MTQPVWSAALSKPSRNDISWPVPASCTSIIGTSAVRVTRQAVTRTVRPDMRRPRTSPMVNRPALRRGSAIRNISRSSERAVLRARTTPSKPNRAMTPPVPRTVAAEM